MVAAIEMQWLGVAVAALVVAVLLLIVLIRHRSADDKLMATPPPADQAAQGPPAAPSAPPEPAPVTPAAEPAWAPPLAATPAEAGPPAAPAVDPGQTRSFLDEPLSHDFEALGSPASAGHEPAGTALSEATPPAEQAADLPAAAPQAGADASEPEAPAAPAYADHGPFPVDPFGSHEDIFPPDDAQAPIEAAPAEAAPAEEPRAEAAPAEEPPAEAAPIEPAPQPSATAEASAPVLLSDILVTTGDAEVDLTDPGVRRLLEQLVGDEIELARQCRAKEQTLDAILQLTEAEKVCEALGLDDRLAEVRALLAELQA